MMRDEEKFNRALELTNIFSIMDCEVQIHHPKIPVYIEVDNIAQRKRELFIFEGKSKNEEKAIDQLKLRYISFKQFKYEYISKRLIQDFDFIRLFLYSFKRSMLVECDSKGKIIKRMKFTDLINLIEILKKI